MDEAVRGGLRLCVGEELFYLVEDEVGGDGEEAAVVAVAAVEVAVGGAGLAGEVGAEGVGAVLAEAVEAEVGMGGPPDADDGGAHDGGEVHVGGVHGDHQGECLHDFQFFGEGLLPCKG